MAERRIYRGVHDRYYWLTSTEDYSGTLFRVCPEIVLGRYVAVTAVDGGIVRLSGVELDSGWQSWQGIAYSPKINSAVEIMHQVDGAGAPGYDEYYVFKDRCELGERLAGNVFLEGSAPAPGRTAVFVTWSDFVLHDTHPAVQSLVALFWPQLDRLQPESYIADGDKCLTVVTKNADLLDRLHQLLESVKLL